MVIALDHGAQRMAVVASAAPRLAHTHSWGALLARTHDVAARPGGQHVNRNSARVGRAVAGATTRTNNHPHELRRAHNPVRGAGAASGVVHMCRRQHSEARLPTVLVVLIYSTSVSAGLAVALLLVYPLFKQKAKAL